jgi:hypothetical protein
MRGARALRAHARVDRVACVGSDCVSGLPTFLAEPVATCRDLEGTSCGSGLLTLLTVSASLSERVRVRPTPSR